MLALSLLMLGVLANDHDAAFAADNLALFAHGLHGRSYFHSSKPFLSAVGVIYCSPGPLSLGAPGDPAAGQVIRGQLHRHLVAGQNPDEIHSELSGNMRQNHVSISNVYLERRVRQGLDNHAFHFNHVGFCQTLSLLARIIFLAECRECFAKLTVGDFLFAFDLAGKPVLLRGYE